MFTGLLAEAIHADDHAFAALDFPLVPIGGVLNLGLEEARFDRLQGTAHLIDAADIVDGGPLDLVRKFLDVVAAAQRIGDIGHAGLVGDNLLGPQSQPGGLFGWQADRFIP